MGTSTKIIKRISRGALPDISKWAFERLFDDGEIGLILDPSDRVTMFQKSDGTVPVTAPGQPVGLILDKSRKLVLDQELLINGDFSNGFTNWTLFQGGGGGTSTIVDGKLQLTTPSTGPTEARWQDVTVVADRRYKITVEIDRLVGSTGGMNIYNGAGFVTLLGQRGSSGDMFVRPTTTTLRIYLYSQNLNTINFDNISVREIAGNHASQSSDASRPMYGIMPVGTPRRNILERSESFNISGTWVPNLLTFSRQEFIPTTDLGGHYLSQTVASIAVGNRYTFWVEVKPNGYAGLTLNIGASRLYANFNLLAGSILSTLADEASWSDANATIEVIDNGYYRCTISGTCLISSSATHVPRITINAAETTNSPTGQSYAGDGTSGMFVRRSQLEIGSEPTEYQHVGSSYGPRRNLIPSTDPTTISTSADIPRISVINISGYELGEFRPNAATVISSVVGVVIPPVIRYGAPQSVSWVIHPGDFEVLRTSRSATSWPTINIDWNFTTKSPTLLSTSPELINIIMDELGGGVFRCGFSFIGTSAADVGITSGYRIAPPNAIDSDGIKTFFVGAMQTEEGQIPTNYQHIAGQYDITEAGKDTCHYLQFDGIDDFLVTNTIDFSTTDKMSVFTGIRKLSDAAQGTLCELTTLSTNAGAFSLFVGNSTTTRRLAWSAAAPQDFLGTSEYAGVTSIINTVTFDKSGIDAPTTIFPRVSGVIPTISETTSGNSTGNFANSILYIGRRAGTTAPFNGQLFNMVIRNAISTETEILQAEKLASKNTSEIQL